MNVKKSLISIVLILVSLAALYFFVLPGWNKLTEKKMRLNQALAEQERLLAAQQELESFLNEFESLNEEAETINKAVPLKQAEHSQILAGLDEMARASGLILGSLAFSDLNESDAASATNNSIQTQEVSLTTLGSFPAFKNFLLRAENSLRIIDIEEVRFGTENENGITTFNVRFKTYYQAQFD